MMMSSSLCNIPALQCVHACPEIMSYSEMIVHIFVRMAFHQGLHVVVTIVSSNASDLCLVHGSCLQHYKNRRYSSYGSYGTSKLANILFAKELARRCGMPLSSRDLDRVYQNCTIFSGCLQLLQKQRVWSCVP